jgi:pyruvate,water dikinase
MLLYNYLRIMVRVKPLLNPAVLTALERVVAVAKKMGVTSSICGQAPSVYPGLTEKLVE